MLAISVRRKSTRKIEFGRPIGDGVEDAGSDDRADQLRDDVRADEIGRKTASARKPHGDRRVKMTSGEMTDRIGHCQHGQAESQGYTEQSDTDMRESGRDHCAAASAKRQPERAYALGRKTFSVHHDPPERVIELRSSECPF